MKFLFNVSQTQLFMEYFEKINEPLAVSRENEQTALFIADWLFFRWKRFYQRKLKNTCLTVIDQLER